jgi:subtilisin-like proprotein convertase family protein
MKRLFIFFLFGFAAALRADVFVSTEVPMAIPDGPSGIARSHLTIDVHRAIIDLNVILSITHPFDADLRLYIQSPTDDVVRLADRCGTSGDNYTETCFDDEAAVAICEGDPPFTGHFQPDGPLSAFDGQSTYGMWTLRITDNAANDVGTLTAWRLDIALGDTLNVQPTVSSLPVNLNFAGNYPNPFNSQTEFRFSVARPADVALTLYNALGREVAVLEHGRFATGEYTIPFYAGTLSTGIYFARLEAGPEAITRKVILLR